MARNGNSVATVSPVSANDLMAGILSRFAAGCRPLQTLDSDAEALDELFEERAAIREFDGGLNREDAEILAREEVRRARDRPSAG